MAQEIKIQNIQQLFQVIAQHFGAEIGKQVREQIENIVNISNTDVAEINKKIEVIQKLLDADPNTPEFDVAQNIIATIKNIIEQIRQNAQAIDELKADLEKAKKDLEAKIEAKADKEYVNANFVNVKEMLGINIDAIVNDFAKCLSASLNGENCEEISLNNKLTNKNNKGQNPQTNSSSDGAVL